MRVIANPGVTIMGRHIINPPTARWSKPMPPANESREVLSVEQGNFTMGSNPSCNEEQSIHHIQNVLHFHPD